MEKYKLLKPSKEFFLKNGEMLLRKQISHSGRKPNAIRIFSADELETATNNYDHDRLIAPSGSTYKGILDGRTISVKVCHGDFFSAESILTEVVILSNINHRNVVKLLGCCLETQFPILVYEFIPNGTLSDYMSSSSIQSRQPLAWQDCLRIATEIADALSYLHYHSSQAIVHRDVHSSKILLDEHYNAKLVGFDFSVLKHTGEVMQLAVVGTSGNLDPEYAISGLLTEKSDVYGFGIILFVLLIGEKVRNPYKFEGDPNHLAELEVGSLSFHKLLVSAIEEGRLEGFPMGGAKTEQLHAFAEVAMKCIRPNGEERPNMKEVVQELRKIGRLDC